MRIGICGGTFDPFHRGHLDPILHVRGEMQWDRVLYIPARMQPFKQDRQTASPYHRFAMTAMATLGEDRLHVSSMELERDTISYTVDTLEELRARHPEDTLDWIIGDDNLAKLLEWKSLDRIFELANFAVLARGEHALPPSLASRRAGASARATHGSIVFAHNPTVPVSSTEIRRRVSAGESIGDLVPEPVSRYIHHYGLYRKGQS
ncbi:MAG TPA: nicotinate-nucleotide adenylyltransferase [Thermoanaerobaculia bacterium]|jgi:nicotinate-nucleotide adenylyltransferase|nr:nicotinate-nucleotide adenylyltransferase [Thermoanaerobaculia bacterium]